MQLARFRFPVGVRYADANLGGVAARTARPAKSDVERHVLWFHGGGYMMGSPEASLPESGVLAKWARAEVTLPRYRLAPEHPFPAAFDDAVVAARAFLDVHDPATAVFAGDSAGAALALGAACALRDEGGPLPAALYLQSPFVDCSRASVDHDPMIDQSLYDEGIELYLGQDVDRTDWRASPLFADHAGLPPTLIQAGGAEAVLTDATRLAASMCDTTLDVAPGLWHVYQKALGYMPEARRAFEQGAEFIRARTAGS